MKDISRTKLAVVGLGLIVVTFLAVNIFSNTVFRASQIDLTEDKLYTLSEGTRTILKAIDEPIKVRFFFSKLLGQRSPAHQTYAQRVREILERYVEISNGKIQLEVYNPEPFSDIEDRAVSLGLRGGRLNDSGDLGYFGIVANNSVDDQQTIPFLDPAREAFVEYDLTKMIYSLAHPTKTVIGVISTLPIGGWTPEPFSQRRERDWPIIGRIAEFFEIKRLDSTVKVIPPEINVLMLVHPRNLKDDTLYAIDQFVLRGGKVLAFADGLNEVEALTQQGGFFVTAPSDINKLLNAWGIQVVKDRVAGDIDSAQRVSTTHQTGTQSASEYVAWLALTADNFDQKDVVSADLEGVNIASSAILERVEGATTQMQPLMMTGPRAMALELRKVQSGPDVLGLLREYKPEGKRLTLAARVTGPVKTAFPDGAPPIDAAPANPAMGSPAETTPPVDDRPPHIKESSADGINVIVVGDADMLNERFWARVQDVFGQQVLVPFANNGNFVINALDNLTGSNALIKLRARGQAARPFVMVNNIRRDAELQFRAKEQELQNKMTEVQEKLNKLIGQERPAGEIKLTAEEDQQINAFRRELVSIRRQIRDVQHDLRKDIDRLDMTLKFLNIAAIPLLLVVVTIGYGVIRRLRRARQVTLH